MCSSTPLPIHRHQIARPPHLVCCLLRCRSNRKARMVAVVPYSELRCDQIKEDHKTHTHIRAVLARVCVLPMLLCLVFVQCICNMTLPLNLLPLMCVLRCACVLLLAVLSCSFP